MACCVGQPRRRRLATARTACLEDGKELLLHPGIPALLSTLLVNPEQRAGMHPRCGPALTAVFVRLSPLRRVAKRDAIVLRIKRLVIPCGALVEDRLVFVEAVDDFDHLNDLLGRVLNALPAALTAFAAIALSRCLLAQPVPPLCLSALSA
eukprot:2875355-Prymnesium_polylepis.1